MKIKILALALLTMSAFGCASGQVRYLTATRWTEAPGGAHVYYVTYYEGTCSSGVLGFNRGCKSGDSHVRRCTLQADNSVQCVDEAEATKALAKQ